MNETATLPGTAPVYHAMTASSWVWIALSLGIVAFFYLLRRGLRRKTREQNSSFLWLLYQYLNKPAQAIVIVIAASIMLQQLPFTTSLRDELWFNKAFSLLIIALVTWICIDIVYVCAEEVMRHLNIRAQDNRSARRIYTQVNFIRRLAVSSFLLIALASSLMVFDQIRSLGVSLMASAGVAGIILGFAAQKTVGSFFTGLQIAITQPISIEDAVIVEGEWGVIEEINLSYVVVKLWDLRRMIVPINYFVEKPFQNWTRREAALLGAVMFYLDYTAPVAALRTELDRILSGTDLWNGAVKVVQVTDIREQVMEIRMLASADDAGKAFDLRCLIREKIMDFLVGNYPEALPKRRLDGEIPPDAPLNAGYIGRPGNGDGGRAGAQGV
jgi:small-conductance mechanosensitive channel